ncbi:MAG: CYTH domain-containing protein [Thermodesulfobacteriota bacterium]|nr:CYTH domain-containing protein [Thermodesulfobacteriota bacterium]
MAIEIERKFLLANQQWREQVQSQSKYIQGYLSRCPERTVRVRVADDHAWLTIKGENIGAVRPEYEYPIPTADALGMLAQLCEQPVIEKWRHRIMVNRHLWEIDEFLGKNSGLIVAEIELKQEDEIFVRPSWLGAEVTDDKRYFNSCLISNPYCEW